MDFGEKIDDQKDIEKEQLYVGLEDNLIVVIYALNQECDKEYENGNWKYRDESFYIVHRLCVNPHFQNKGIAKLTLLHIETQLKSKGIYVIRLDVFQNNPFAIRLYDSLDYSKVGYTHRVHRNACAPRCKNKVRRLAKGKILFVGKTYLNITFRELD